MPQFLRPSSTITDNDWVASAGELWACVDETPASDTDYIQATSNQTVELKFSSGNDPDSSTGHTIRLRARVSTGSGGAERWTVTIYQGTTLIATPFNNTTVARTTWTDYSYTLTASEANAITNYADLRVRIVTSQGTSEVTQVSFIEFEIPNPYPGYSVSTGNLFGEIGISRNGPFCDSNGNLYLVLSNSTTQRYVEVWKSTNNGQTWAQQDSANKPDQDGVNDVNTIDVVQSGSVLHIATYSSTADDVFYHRFRMSSDANPDTWAVVDTLVASYTDTTSEFGLAITVQPDGDLIIISAADNGTYYTGRECVEYHYSQNNGSSWSTKHALLTTDSDNLAQAIVTGASGKIHTFTKEEAFGRYIHRSLTDVTATPSTAESASAGVTVPGENYVHGKGAVYYDSSGAEKVVFSYLDSTYTPYVTRITDDGTPANGVQATTEVVHRTLRFYSSTAHISAHTLCVYNKDVYLVYGNNTTKNIRYVKSSDGGSFGSPVDVAVDAQVDELSANIYVRSGTIYLGVAWIAGGDTSTSIRYIAYSLGSASYSLTATNITTGTPVLGAPTLGQKHALTANGITTGTPVLGAPTLAQVNHLTANGITTGTPVLDAPTLGQKHILVANGITTGTPILGAPTLGQKHVLTANDIAAGIPVLGTPSLSLIHTLTANDITTGAPILGSPTLEENYLLVANGITTGIPVLGAPLLGQIHALDANDITTGIPVLGSPSLAQIHALDANDITTGIPVLGAPVLAQTHVLSANDITTGIPVLGTPSLAQIHALDANNITTGIPVLGTPSIGQVHALDANDITTGIPVLGTPTLSINQGISLIATDITIGNPILGAPLLGQIHALDANDISTGIPVLGAPSLGAIYSLDANDITTGIPVLGAPSLGSIYALDANDITTGIPVLGTPSLGSIYALDANDITTGIPILDAPVLGQIHALDANDITTGIPVLGTPFIGQVHTLAANGIITGVPVFGTPTLTINEGISLVSTDIITGVPVLGTPSLAQIHILSANGIVTGIPILENPYINQIYVLDANDITTGTPILDTPILGQIHELVANGITTSRPVLGAPVFKFNIIIPDELTLVEYKEWTLSLIEIKEYELFLVETK